MVNLCISTVLESISIGGDDLFGHLYLNNRNDCNEVAVFLADFARTGTEEPLFMEIAKNLKVPCLLFDYTGFGGSCGNHQNLSVPDATNNFIDVCQALKKMGFEKIYPITHSFGSAVLGEYLYLGGKQNPFEKIVLLAPALNQAGLMRYWFTGSKFPGVNIVSFDDSFESAGGEVGFAKWCQEIKIVREKVFLVDYWMSEKNNDYSRYFVNTNSLWIHGQKDETVPMGIAKTESFGRALFLENADHDFTGCYNVVTNEINSFLAE